MAGHSGSRVTDGMTFRTSRAMIDTANPPVDPFNFFAKQTGCIDDLGEKARKENFHCPMV
jgi:hypothetical protein